MCFIIVCHISSDFSFLFFFKVFKGIIINFHHAKIRMFCCCFPDSYARALDLSGQRSVGMRASSASNLSDPAYTESLLLRGACERGIGSLLLPP